MVDCAHSFDISVAELDPAATLPKPAVGRGSGRKPQVLEFSRGQIAALFVLFAAIASIPILLHPLPPLADYINHLSRMHVIAAIGSDPDLSRFYEVDWQVIPNLMMDLVLPVLVRIMSIYSAGQAYTIASFAMILSGTFALNRQLHGRWCVLPLVAFPMLYNYVFLVGTMNYVFGIGLSLWALVAWIAVRERNLFVRLTVSTLFVLALFFCHLFALGTYGLGLLAFELNRLWMSYAGRRQSAGATSALSSLIFNFVATGVPFLPVLPLLMMSPTWGLRSDVSWELPGKIDGLIFVIDVYSDAMALLLAAVVVVGAGFALYHRALRFHAFGYLLLAVGAIVYMAMPRVIFDTYMADQRLPISLAFMVVACAQLDLRQGLLHHRLVRHGLIAALALLLAARVFEVQTMWTALSPDTASFRESVELIDRGAKVVVAYADPDGGDDVHNLGLVHAACLAIIERSALVTTVFSVVGKQVLHVCPDYRGRVDVQDGSPPTMDDLVRVADSDADTSADDYWRRWTADYDYLYVLFTDSHYENPDPTRLTPIFSGGKFMLYRIEHSQVADAGKSAK
jgi:hypothetical protein